jgi:hypothetical protein
MNRAQQLVKWNIIILFAVMLSVAGVIYFVPSRHTGSNSELPVIKPLPREKQTYTISTRENGPKITLATVDPFDPTSGEVQTFEVSANYSKPITDMQIILVTDHTSSTILLTQASGTLTDGVWIGRITTNDSHDFIYSALIRARSGANTTPVDLSFR